MISVFGSDVGPTEIAEVESCMTSQWMGFGAKVREFEESFSQRRGLSNFAMVDSGSNALYLAVELLDLPAGSEVVVPSFTWVSCAQAILLAGCVPVFCDVDPNTMNVTAETIAPRLSEATSAIMVVHYAGLAVDMDPIQQLDLPIVEDAAHAVVSTYKDKPCGGIGDAGIFSFDAVKNLAVGEGGGICTRSPEMLERAQRLRYCGIGKSGFEAATQDASKRTRWWEYSIDEAFIKMLPTNIAASIGLGQLERLDDLQTRRSEIWHMYDEGFSDLDFVELPIGDNGRDTHSRFTYCIRVPRRDELAHYLLDKGIYTTLRYHPLHLNEIYKQSNVRLPVCESLNETALSIPLHPRLSDQEVDKVIDALHSFYEK